MSEHDECRKIALIACHHRRGIKFLLFGSAKQYPSSLCYSVFATRSTSNFGPLDNPSILKQQTPVLLGHRILTPARLQSKLHLEHHLARHLTYRLLQPDLQLGTRNPSSSRTFTILLTHRLPASSHLCCLTSRLLVSDDFLHIRCTAPAEQNINKVLDVSSLVPVTVGTWVTQPHSLVPSSLFYVQASCTYP